MEYLERVQNTRQETSKDGEGVLGVLQMTSTGQGGTSLNKKGWRGYSDSQTQDREEELGSFKPYRKILGNCIGRRARCRRLSHWSLV